MGDVNYISFDVKKLNFERNSISVKDKETNRDVAVHQLLFNYENEVSPVKKMADGRVRSRFVLQGPRMKTSRPISERDGKNGSKSYSIFQPYDMNNAEHAEWVDVNRRIHARVSDELSDKDVKAWMKHTALKSVVPSLTPCLIYQKTAEDENGEMVFEEGSHPSSYLNFFEATTKDGRTFGTKVRLAGSRTDLTREQWIRLLTRNCIEYVPYVSYLRISYVGGNFRLITQLDTLIIYDVTPYERKTSTDIRQENLVVTEEDMRRARMIEELLNNPDTVTLPSRVESESYAAPSTENDW